MIQILDLRKIVAGLVLVGAILLTGCEEDPALSSGEPVLRIHDVSGLQVDSLDKKLNELLSREDLPLRGRVELLDDNRLAVNASRYLQDEITAMIGQLRDQGPMEKIERAFQVQYWILRMARGEGDGDVPDSVHSDLVPLLDEFEGYALSVEDYMETHHRPGGRVGMVSSGRGAHVSTRAAEATEAGMVIQALVSSPGEAGSITYQVNHTLVPGRALVLGQAHDGGYDEQASYQVLVAKAKWTGPAD